MNALIIEDERRAANRLIKLIVTYDSDIKILDRLESVKSAVGWLTSNSAPDLIFMDIQLADGMCFDIFDEISLSCPVIFTTAYDEYAIKAFKVNSIDYLLKPIGFKDFKAAMDKFISLRASFVSVKENIEDIKIVSSQSYKSRFVVKLGDHLNAIKTDEIVCFCSKEKLTYIFTSENKSYIIDYTLEQLEHLVNPVQFFRISRKHLINIDFIKDIILYQNSRLKLILKTFDDPDEVLVSRERVQDFKNWLDR